MSDLQYEEWRKKCEQEIKRLQSKVAKHILLAQKYSSRRDQITMALNTVSEPLDFEELKRAPYPEDAKDCWNFFPVRRGDE